MMIVVMLPMTFICLGHFDHRSKISKKIDGKTTMVVTGSRCRWDPSRSVHTVLYNITTARKYDIFGVVLRWFCSWLASRVLVGY
jgi:hypothetical protein